MEKQIISADVHTLSEESEEEIGCNQEGVKKRKPKEKHDKDRSETMSEDEKFSILLRQNQALIDMLQKR